MENAFSIRRMLEADIPAVVDLQRYSLGEGLIPRTEEFWRWKHLDNPFGSSPVLLAFDGDKLIGLRAFMRWNWQKGSRIYRCLRAVDTATHPDYRGRGLFRTLTLQLIKAMKEEDYDFIFNTPNEKSRPGYLKMGWKEAGRIPILIHLGNIKGIWGQQTLPPAPPADYQLHRVNWQKLQFLLDTSEALFPEKLQTPLSAQFWKWRYMDVPEIHYFGGLFEAKGWVWMVGRIKTTMGKRELRLVELSGTDDALAERCLQNLVDHYQPAFISRSSLQSGVILNKFGIKFDFGPKFVLRHINSLPEELLNLNHWSPSLGDFELF
jgi:GNAT superfamily N-acetyltransferase